MKFKFITAGLLSVALIASCGNQKTKAEKEMEDFVEWVEDKTDSDEEYTLASWEKFEDKYNDKVDKLDNHTDEVSDDLEESYEDAKESYKETKIEVSKEVKEVNSKTNSMLDDFEEWMAKTADKTEEGMENMDEISKSD